MKPFLLLLLAAFVAVGVWERRSVSGLRAENSALREQQAAAAPLVEEIAALERRLGAAPEPVPEFDRSELLRLRNDVRRLRSSPADPAKLRAENERLAADLKSGKIRPPRLADQPGFVARESWANVGTATPEAALQTLFSAMRDANIEVMLTLVRDNEARKLQEEFRKNPEKMREEFSRQASKQFQPAGFVIDGSEPLEGDKARLKVRFAAQSEPMEFEFQREGNVWKMSKGF